MINTIRCGFSRIKQIFDQDQKVNDWTDRFLYAEQVLHVIYTKFLTRVMVLGVVSI